MSTLNSRLQLSILNRKKGKNLAEKGFTLIELMITIVIVGVLSATALPQFLGVKEKSEATARIGEFIGLAQECSSSIKMDGPWPDTYSAKLKAKGIDKDCHGGIAKTTAPIADINYTGEAIPADLAGTVSCGPDIKLAADKKCNIKVKFLDGNMEFSEVS